MAITIDDIYDKEFALKGGGYDRDDVDQFLDEICDEMVRMQDEMHALQLELGKAKEALAQAEIAAVPVAPEVVRTVEQPVAEDQVKKASSTLESILRNAQTLADEEVENARKKAEEMLQQAQAEAAQIVDDARAEKDVISGSLDTMRAAASEYRTNFLNLLKKSQELLEGDASLFGKDDAEEA